MRPSNVAEVEDWLRNLRDWRGELATAGLYTVPAADGTNIHSSRPGDPTQRAVLLRDSIAARIRVVEQWLADMSPMERCLADWYVEGQALTQLAAEVGLAYEIAHGITRGLPYVVWARWYAPGLTDLKPPSKICMMGLS